MNGDPEEPAMVWEPEANEQVSEVDPDYEYQQYKDDLLEAL